MKSLPTILALSLLLTACSRKEAESTKDAELSKQVAGTWTQAVKKTTNTLTIAPDGNFSYFRSVTDNQLAFTNTGTWQINDGVMVMTATSRVGTLALPLGNIFTFTIVHLDDHLWINDLGEGRTITFRR